MVLLKNKKNSGYMDLGNVWIKTVKQIKKNKVQGLSKL